MWPFYHSNLEIGENGGGSTFILGIELALHEAYDLL